MTSKTIHSDSDPFLTTSEVAQRLGVTLRAVQLWVDAGKLQAARTPGGHRRIRTSDVQALQGAMGIRPAKPAAVVLTEAQIHQIAEDVGMVGPLSRVGNDHEVANKFARAIEAAAHAANTPGANHD